MTFVKHLVEKYVDRITAINIICNYLYMKMSLDTQNEGIREREIGKQREKESERESEKEREREKQTES